MNHHDQVTAARLKKLEHEMGVTGKRLLQLAQEFEKRTVHLAQQQQAMVQGFNAMAAEVSTLKELTHGHHQET